MLLSSKFPSSSMQGKLEDKEILCFQLNFPVSRGDLEDKRNRGYHVFTVIIRFDYSNNKIRLQ
jgi:hypothetical protein